ncbi:MAG: hypothetical protein IJL94_04080 [Erysipelotrichaceae bacterium]|nr:hypothetical protein [Erysipelotrichaceae bacterium]
MVCYMLIEEKGLKERLLEYLEDMKYSYYQCPFNEAFSCNHKAVLKSDSVLSVDTENKLIKLTSTYTARNSVMPLKAFLDVLHNRKREEKRETVYLPVSTGQIRKGEIVKTEGSHYIVRFADGGMARVRKDKTYFSMIEAERHV